MASTSAREIGLPAPGVAAGPVDAVDPGLAEEVDPVAGEEAVDPGAAEALVGPCLKMADTMFPKMLMVVLLTVRTPIQINFAWLSQAGSIPSFAGAYKEESRQK
jgi:hypothetical protein